MAALAPVLVLGPGRPVSVVSGRYARLARTVGAVLLCAALASTLVGIYRLYVFVTSREIPQRPPVLSPLSVLSDLRPVVVTMTTPAFTKVRETVTMDAIRADHRLWRQMHFADWDAVPQPVRDSGLRAMVRAYAHVFKGPALWRTMTAADWDEIPQPVRAMAYLRMIWYWALAEDVGAEFGLEPSGLAQTIGAIVMAESWFEHRAVNEKAWGNRDLGLAQCSDHCRETIDAMAVEGAIGFAPSDADYFEPWIAARVATVWFERELHRAGGDVDLAIRAYHRGITVAADETDEKGTTYHARVIRLRERYIRTQQASESWRFLTRAIASL